MSDLISALGFLLVIEGVLYLGFPNALKRLAVVVLQTDDARLRTGGFAAALLGLGVVYLARG